MQVSGETGICKHGLYGVYKYIFMAGFKPLVSTLQFVDHNVRRLKLYITI